MQVFFDVRYEKFKPQHNKAMLLLQYCKLSRDETESAKAYMGHLRIKGVQL